MSIAQRTITGLLWMALDQWGSKAASFLTFLILARLLSPEAFGLVALATVFVAFAHVIADQGFTDAIVQRDALNDLHVHSAFWVNVTLALGLIGVTWLTAPWIAVLFNEPELEDVLQGMSLIFGIRALTGVQEALFRRDVEFKALSVGGFIGVCGGAGVGIGMAVAGYGVWSLVVQQIVHQIIYAIILWWMSPWTPQFLFSFLHAKDLFSFGLGVLGANILNFFNRRMDDLLIGGFLGSTALGYYNVAYRILLALTQMISSVGSRVMFPVFSQLQHNLDRLRQSYYAAIKYTVMLSAPIYVGLAVLAPYIIPTAFGAKWEASVPIMQVLSFVGILHSVLYFNSPVILSQGRSLLNMSLTMLRAIVNFTAFLIAVQWGIFAVAVTYTAMGYLLAPVEVGVVHRLIQINWKRYIDAVLPPIVASGIAAGAVLTLSYGISKHISVIAMLAAGACLGAIVFSGVLLLVRPGLIDELRHLKITALSKPTHEVEETA
ncbi:MOP flippase family protein [Salisaeta longa]|uniref:MOP flippase family protein n=1 Tax=Salisaeta longa TaxID=503170 RepID=UPI0003B70082|nr:MOP flippase family protein [Salisaeta longa]